LVRFRTFCRWAVDNDIIPTDPTAGVRKPHKNTPRDRVLADAEMRAFWSATERMGYPFGPLFRLLLLTGQREAEVAGMCWSELDDAEAPTLWTIPSSRTKNGKSHTVHLGGALAQEVLAAVPRVASQDMLFTTTGETAVSGFSEAKRKLDAIMADAIDGEIEHWVLHDLRRTATTLMAQIGIPPHIADRVLNHTGGTISGVAGIYNRFQYIDERKAALDALGRYIEGLIGRAPQNVAPRQKDA
jgi:integrase